MSRYYHANLEQQALESGVELCSPEVKNKTYQWNENSGTKSSQAQAKHATSRCYSHTNGGKSFSAALRGTEKPPCVLVSLAVKVLQKNSLGCLLCLCPKSDMGKTSLSWHRKIQIQTEKNVQYTPQLTLTFKCSITTVPGLRLHPYRIQWLQSHLSIDFICLLVCLS